MARRKKKPSKYRNYAIVVDGKTEVWYFQMLKRNEPGLLVNISPKLPQKKKLSEQYEKVKELSEDHTKVFWIIDLDIIIKETREGNKSREAPIKQLRKYIKELEENYKNVIVILNNPCLEFWFLLHFKQTTKFFDSCKKVERELKSFIEDYKKEQKYFTKAGNDIYLRLKPKLKEALNNAKRTQRGDLEEFKRAICEMNLFFEAIGLGL